MKPPTVIALVPAWNAAAFIEETLRALAAQTYGNLRVLISDDASTDNTLEICHRFAAQRENWRVIRQAKNLGWVGNTNALLHAAEGDYYFFAFHDDLVAPTYAERLVAALEAEPQAVLAFADMDTLHENNRCEQDQYDLLDDVDDPYQRGETMVRRAGSWWTPNRGLFRATTARDIGGLRKHWGGEFSADWAWLVGLTLRGKFVRVREALVVKRYLGHNLSRTWAGNARQRFGLLMDVMGVIARSPLRPHQKIKLQAHLTVMTAIRARRRLIQGR